MLLSLAAGGVGLNLIGGNHLFISDLHWNPQLEAQACDRVFRLGQTKEVFIHRMIATGTVDERIDVHQKNKLEIAKEILGGTAKMTRTGLSMDDLEMLFLPPRDSYRN